METNKIVFIVLIFTFTSIASNAQIKGSASFWGINPSVTVEPFYEKGELDINIFPLVYQKTISNRIDLRVSTIVNYGIRIENSAFSHLGARVAFPVFIIKKDENTLPSSGFFVAPGFGFTRNLIEEHNNFGLWIEPGYNLQISPKYSISFGAQFGATHFWYDSGTTKWGNHFGVMIIFGRWL